MYTFVFLWTPSLSPNGEKLPHGFIFAIYMTASMVGTALAGKLIKRVKLEQLMQVGSCAGSHLFLLGALRIGNGSQFGPELFDVFVNTQRQPRRWICRSKWSN